MDQLEQSARDALSEAHEVLTDLRQFLFVLGKTARTDEQAALKEVGDSLEAVANKIATLNGTGALRVPAASPQAVQIRCV